MEWIKSAMRNEIFAKNLLDVTVAMTKVHCTCLLDIETCSVTFTKAFILQLAFCRRPQHVY